ncbi:MAG: hydrogenase/urease maturation nickel metallochaperone HypA [Acidimicrobiia bacterium]
MHEHDLVAKALGTLRSLTAGQAISEVEIVLGPSVERSVAAKAWETLTANTPLAAAHVTWEQGLDLVRCELCGHEYTGVGSDSCPYCGGDGVVIEPAVPIEVGRWVRGAP